MGALDITMSVIIRGTARKIGARAEDDIVGSDFSLLIERHMSVVPVRGDDDEGVEGPRGSGVQVIFVSEIARSATVLHQPLIEPDDVKWRLAGQGAATVLNCAAQADIVRADALCRVVR